MSSDYKFRCNSILQENMFSVKSTKIREKIAFFDKYKTIMNGIFSSE